MGAIFLNGGKLLCLGHLVLGTFANGGNFIFSGGNFINIKVNQSKIVGKLKILGAIFKNNGGNWGQMGANVLVEFENVFFNWGHFFPILGAIGGNWVQMGANVLVEF